MAKHRKRSAKRSGKGSSGGPSQGGHHNKYQDMSRAATLAASQKTFRAGLGSPRHVVPTFRNSFSYR